MSAEALARSIVGDVLRNAAGDLRVQGFSLRSADATETAEIVEGVANALASAAETVRPSAARGGSPVEPHPDAYEPVFVMFTKPPGPGARMIAEEAADKVDDHVAPGTTSQAVAWREGARAMRTAILGALRDEVGEFIEVETADGEGRGPEHGIGWNRHGAQFALGPFYRKVGRVPGATGTVPVVVDPYLSPGDGPYLVSASPATVGPTSATSPEPMAPADPTATEGQRATVKPETYAVIVARLPKDLQGSIYLSEALRRHDGQPLTDNTAGRVADMIRVAESRDKRRAAEEEAEPAIQRARRGLGADDA